MSKRFRECVGVEELLLRYWQIPNLESVFTVSAKSVFHKPTLC